MKAAFQLEADSLAPAKALDGRLVLAYHCGIDYRKLGRIRIAPYYEEKTIIEGRSVDVTDRLDSFWYAGYDGLRLPQMDPDA